MKTRLVAAVLGLTFSFFCRTEPTQAQDTDWLFVGPDQQYGRANNFVIHSGDGGKTWEKVVLPSRYAVNHAIVSEAGRVWLAAGPELYTTGEDWDEIVLVKDFGDSKGVGRLYLDSNGSLYASVGTAEEGVTLLRSDDEGSSWSAVLIPSERCECALTETKSGYLLLGTNSGVYRSVRPITTSRDREHVNKMGEALSLHVAPNPVHANGRISFDSSASGLTHVEVYDMAGRLSAELARGWMSAGYHELNFDVREWARGVYIVRIRIGVMSQSTLIVVQ